MSTLTTAGPASAGTAFADTGPLRTVDPAAAVARTRPRTTITEIVSQTLIMAWRALKKMRRNPEQFFDVTLQPLLFTAMFAYIFGGAISGNVHSYLPLLIPGIVAQTVLTTCMSTGVQLREDMDKGVFDAVRLRVRARELRPRPRRTVRSGHPPPRARHGSIGFPGHRRRTVGAARPRVVPVPASGGGASARARRPRAIPGRHRPHPGRHHNRPIGPPSALNPC